jgi:hypothetical protein
VYSITPSSVWNGRHSERPASIYYTVNVKALTTFCILCRCSRWIAVESSYSKESNRGSVGEAFADSRWVPAGCDHASLTTMLYAHSEDDALRIAEESLKTSCDNSRHCGRMIEQFEQC